MKRVLFALLTGMLAACGTSFPVGPQFHEPVSMAVFNGFTRAHPGRQVPSPYLAVASSRTDELRIIDLSNNSAVLSPGMAFPLSVPTDPFPIKVASASLQDRDPQGNPRQLPDLLVVATVGGSTLELISTWEDGTGPDHAGTRVWDSRSISSAVPGAQILSLLAIPEAQGAGTARILVGVSVATGSGNGKLVVFDFARVAGSNAIAFSGSPPIVKDLGFDPVDMALSPDGSTVYCATPDVINPLTDAVQGVAAITMVFSDPSTWTVAALNAGPPGIQPKGKPTRLVAAAMVGERQAGGPSSNSDAFSAPALRIYADLDPSGCGPDRDISCGIVTLDPTLSAAQTNLASEIASQGTTVPPVPPQTYRAPFVLPAAPVALAVAMPAASGGQRCIPPDPACASVTTENNTPVLLLAPGSGQRWTTAAMVVGASDGISYVVDLGRSSAADDVSLLSDPTGTKVVNAVATTPAGSAQLGLAPPAGGTLTTDPAAMPANILVTPGYTRNDTWAVSWQGGLPGLINRTATLTVSGGSFSVALAGPGVIDDTKLGVQSSDRVQVVPVDANVAATCPSGETTVGNIDGVAIGTGSLPLAAYPCTLPAGSASVIISVFAKELVLTGTSTGYAGRPALDTAYSFAWADERPGSVLQTACEGGNRQACIDLAVARKARRFYYPGESACAIRAGGCPLFPAMVDPLATGPALQFRVGATSGTLQRGAAITFTTQSGVQPMARAPVSLSIPSAALSFDRSLVPPDLSSSAANDGMVFYVTYLGDVLMEFPPSQSAAGVATLR